MKRWAANSNELQTFDVFFCLIDLKAGYLNEDSSIKPINFQPNALADQSIWPR